MVGSYAGLERYYVLLQTKAHELKLKNVFFAGSVRQPELNAYYKSADVFLCMSEHEGFCIPLLESMAHDVPIVAYAAGAVPETLDGSGILFDEKRFDLVAEMMGRVVNDRALRSSIIQSQRARLQRYAARNLEEELRRHLTGLLTK